MLEARHLTFAYRDEKVLEDVSLEVKSGEVLAIVGPNGSGKTTLLKNLSGVLPAPTGSVFLDQRDLSSLSGRELAKSLSAVEAEIDSRFDFSVREVVELGRIPYVGRWSALGEEDRRIVEEVIDRVGLQNLADRSVSELSTGERQRAWLAMALAQKPKVLLLDEPTAHLDVNFQVAVLELLQGLASEGIAVAFSVHDLTLAALFADRVALVENGQIAAFGPPDEVLTEERLSRVWGTPIAVLRSADSKSIRAISPKC